MFINLSSVSCSSWPSSRQINSALELSGDSIVEDMLFPHFDPWMQPPPLEAKADEYLMKIIDRAKERGARIIVVNVGSDDFAFSFFLANKLLAAGITVVSAQYKIKFFQKYGQMMIDYEFVQFIPLKKEEK